MYFFTSDEHYGHKNIIRFNDRPFDDIVDMDRSMVVNHNEIVGVNDTTIHVGDFSFYNLKFTNDIINQLNGDHIFIRGSHDRWLDKSELKCDYLWEKYIKELKVYVVACHYQMKVWPRSHYGSIQIYGHSHKWQSDNKTQYNVGVDLNDYYPVKFSDILKKLNFVDKYKK